MTAKKNNYKIFISYSTEDLKLAEGIRIQLNNSFKGVIHCFLAKKDISASTAWKDEIKNNIRESDAIISILTRKSIDRPWIYIEWAPFWLEGKTQFFLLANDVKESELIKPMQDFQFVKINDVESVTSFYEQLCSEAKIKEIPYQKASIFVSEINKITSSTKKARLSGGITSFNLREEEKQHPEVHVAGVCIKETEKTIKILIAKRNSDRELYPNLYECCGGQLNNHESFASGVQRHYLNEMSLKVKVLEEFFDVYKIQYKDKVFIPGIVYLCKYVSGTANSKNHTSVQWIKEEDLMNIPDHEIILSLKKEIANLLEKYKKSK